MERICPKTGSVCTVEKLILGALRVASESEERKLGGIFESMRVQAKAGQCQGTLNDGAREHCGNSELPHIQDVYGMQRDARGLQELLPPSMATVVGSN
jgi:hypothetical protein